MNDCCGDRDEGNEALICFARSHCYPSVFLQFAEVVFDQVAPFVGFLVKFCREFPIGFWRYDRNYVTIEQVITQPIRVKGPVRQQLPGGQIADQRLGFAQVMGLSGHQTEVGEVAERVGERQYLRGYPSARATNGLA